MLHCETILRGHVQWLSRHCVELQILDDDCQEKEDFVSCDNLTNAASLSHAKNHNLLSLYLVDFSAIRAKETVWIEGRWILPQLTVRCRE